MAKEMSKVKLIQIAVTQWLDPRNLLLNYKWLPLSSLIKFIICIQMGWVDTEENTDWDDLEKDTNYGFVKGEEYVLMEKDAEGYEYRRASFYYLSKQRWRALKGYVWIRD